MEKLISILLKLCKLTYSSNLNTFKDKIRNIKYYIIYLYINWWSI